MENKIKVRPIKTKYMAGWLMFAKGLDLINKEQDRKNPSHCVYLFEDTEELDKAMGEYIRMRNNEKKNN